MKKRKWAAAAAGYEEHAESRWKRLREQSPAAVSHVLWKLSPDPLEETTMRNMQWLAAQTGEERANKVIPRAFFVLPISARLLHNLPCARIQFSPRP